MNRLQCLKRPPRALDYNRDPDPEHWKTINGAKVHLDKNGNYDGGAGGKFNGNHHYGGPDWKQKKEAVNSLYHAFSSVAAQKQAQVNAQGNQTGNTSAQNVASKATQNGGGNGTITVERPQNEQDELKQFNFIGNQKTAAERLAAVNPHYNEGSEWRNNCQRCVVASELQARGYDVTAKPYDANDNIGGRTFEVWDFDFKNRKNDSGFVTIEKRSQFKKEVVDAFSRWGNGARAIVRVKWAIKYGGHGHVFNAHVENGHIVYTDAQSNKIRDIDEDLSHGTTSRNMYWIMRVDNRKVSNLVSEAVENI